MKITNPIARRLEVYRAMSDPTRVGVALTTLNDEAVGFNEIKRAVKIKNPQTLVYHLDRLIRAGLVQNDKGGYIATPKLRELLEKEGFLK
ncbi:unnamed protein product [marine sediment metagenome]|uniref:DUF7347 domain-containing protein n=1 Tax=marine sediment metagenome TaxID=412755 RepID=X1N675_9ZZZZ